MQRRSQSQISVARHLAWLVRHVVRCTVAHREASGLEEPLEVVHFGRAEEMRVGDACEQLDVPSLQRRAMCS